MIEIRGRPPHNHQEGDTVPLQVKGHGSHWTVSYPNEEKLASPFPVYDKEGVLKSVIHCGQGDAKPMTERDFAGTEREAVEYAQWLMPGVEVTVVYTLTKQQVLDRARKARRDAA